jgi:hypothetical protein
MDAAAAEVHAILQGARPPRGSGPAYRAPGAAAAPGAAPLGQPPLQAAGVGAPQRPPAAGRVVPACGRGWLVCVL